MSPLAAKREENGLKATPAGLARTLQGKRRKSVAPGGGALVAARAGPFFLFHYSKEFLHEAFPAKRFHPDRIDDRGGHHRYSGCRGAAGLSGLHGAFQGV